MQSVKFGELNVNDEFVYMNVKFVKANDQQAVDECNEIYNFNYGAKVLVHSWGKN